MLGIAAKVVSARTPVMLPNGLVEGIASVEALNRAGGRFFVGLAEKSNSSSASG